MILSFKRILFILIFCFAPFCFAEQNVKESGPESLQFQSPAYNAAFSHVYVSIEGGEIYPMGDLMDAVENAFYGGVGLRYTYWDDFDGFVHFNYTYFKVRADGIPFPGVNQFIGRLGLDWSSKMISPLALGVGFTCNWTRADAEDDTHFNGRGGMLTDNETEFGYFVRGNFAIIQTDNYKVGLNILWENLWTLPQRSNMLSAGLYVERRLW